MTKTIYYDYSDLWEQIVIHFCIAIFWGEGSAAQIYCEISSQVLLSYRKIKLFTLNHHHFSSYPPRHGFLGKFALDKVPCLFNTIVASFLVDNICPAVCVEQSSLMRAKIILLLNIHPVVKMSTSSPDHALFPPIRNVALEAARRNCWARAPPLLEPARLEPVLCSEKPPRWEAPALQWRVTSTHCRWREPEFSNKDPDEPKLNKQMNNTRNTATQKSQMLFHPTSVAAPV